MEIYLTKVCRNGTKNNVEQASRLIHSILKIKTTILCCLTVDNDAEEIYIYVYKD